MLYSASTRTAGFLTSSYLVSYVTLFVLWHDTLFKFLADLSPPSAIFCEKSSVFAPTDFNEFSFMLHLTPNGSFLRKIVLTIQIVLCTANLKTAILTVARRQRLRIVISDTQKNAPTYTRRMRQIQPAVIGLQHLTTVNYI